MWKKILRFRPLLVLSIMALYCVILLRNLDEGKRRSLQLRDDTDSADHVVMSVLVTGVNPATQELTAQIGLRPQGALAQDEVTPAVDLKLLTNNVRSQQEFEFPKGKRMNRIEAVFPLNGEVNRYPLDHYETTLWLLMTTPARKVKPQTSKIPQSAQVPESGEEEAPQGDHLAVGATALQQSTMVPLTIALSASTPGIKFKGNVSRQSSLKVTGIELKIRRADNVIAVSILLMMLMIGLAMSLLGMVFKATTQRLESRSGSPIHMHLTDFWFAGTCEMSSPVFRPWERLGTISPSSGQKLSWVRRPSYSSGPGCCAHTNICKRDGIRGAKGVYYPNTAAP